MEEKRKTDRVARLVKVIRKDDPRAITIGTMLEIHYMVIPLI